MTEIERIFSEDVELIELKKSKDRVKKWKNQTHSQQKDKKMELKRIDKAIGKRKKVLKKTNPGTIQTSDPVQHAGKFPNGNNPQGGYSPTPTGSSQQQVHGRF